MTVTDLGLPGTSGLSDIPPSHEHHTAKDFKSDQEVRWCPGCGDYAILNTMQTFLPTLGIKRENIVFISGIGCSSRFPYYMNTYGMHSIHGRAPAIATGLAVTRPDLSIWVITGDGDALSIGGNHLIHTLRRNVNLKILLFNNRIYGLTKGQYSPTSETGKITKSTPTGSPDHPFNPLALALGADATFIARTLDNDRTQLTHILTQAATHRGSAFIEIYQNCPIFNDGAFNTLKQPNQHHLIPLTHGQPIRFGPHNQYTLTHTPHGTLTTTTTTEATEHTTITHDETLTNPTYAFALTQITTHTVTGILRNTTRPTYDDQIRHHTPTTTPNLQQLLTGTNTWTTT
jgi:2-oxoglutarate/2-oxoacid ferredoxin oxidoreductase subunit beta